MAKYKVSSAVQGRDGVSNTSFRLGKPGQEGTIAGRIGDEVELSDEQLKQLERSPFEFTAVDGTEAPRQTQDSQYPQHPQEPQQPQPPTGDVEAPVASAQTPR